MNINNLKMANSVLRDELSSLLKTELKTKNYHRLALIIGELDILIQILNKDDKKKKPM